MTSRRAGGAVIVRSAVFAATQFPAAVTVSFALAAPGCAKACDVFGPSAVALSENDQAQLWTSPAGRLDTVPANAAGAPTSAPGRAEISTSGTIPPWPASSSAPL